MEKKTLVSLFISFLMVSSVLGFVVGQLSTTQKLRYNNKVFTFENNRYYTEINDVKVGFYSSPEAVEKVEIPSQFIDRMLATKMIVFTADYNDSLIQQISTMAYEMHTTLLQTDNLYVQSAFTTNVTQLPPVTCANATSSVPVIYVKQGQNMTAVFENNCLTLTITSQYDAASYEDRILYGYYGVI